MEEKDEPDAVPAPPPVTPAAAAPPPVPDYDEAGVPSFDHVRERIESRYATALGADELAAESPAGRALAEQEAERAKAAAEKLAELRRSVRGE